jgi:ABC-type nitrate/sulfonate/bicarbonate transport system permease component
MINDARYNFRTDQMLVGMACIGMLEFTLNTLLLKIERRLVRLKAS